MLGKGAVENREKRLNYEGKERKKTMNPIVIDHAICYEKQGFKLLTFTF